MRKTPSIAPRNERYIEPNTKMRECRTCYTPTVNYFKCSSCWSSTGEGGERIGTRSKDLVEASAGKGSLAKMSALHSKEALTNQLYSLHPKRPIDMEAVHKWRREWAEKLREMEQAWMG